MLKYILITKIFFLIVVNLTNQLETENSLDNHTHEEILLSEASHTENDYTKEYFKEVQNNFDLKKLVNKKNLNDPNFINKLFKLKDLKEFKDKKREAGNKILNHFIYRNLKDFSPVKKLIYDSHCESKLYDDLKVSKNDTVEKILAPFTYEFFKKGKGLVQTWHKFYQQFYELVPSFEIKEVENNDQETYNQIKNNLREFKSEDYIEFFKELKEFKVSLIKVIDRMNCGVINMLNFYDVLPRFYYVYKETTPTLSINQRYRDLFFLKNDFFKEFADKFFHRIYFCHFWGILLEEFLFLTDNDSKDNSYFLLMNVYNLKYFVEPATYSVTKFDDFELSIENNYKKIRNLLERIEDNVLLDEDNNAKLKSRTFKTLEQILETQELENSKIVSGLKIFTFFEILFFLFL